MSKPQHITRDDARERLVAKVENYRRAVADPRHFATVDPQIILDDAEWRLRWLDCAPDGANHQLAPMQDKTGTPMGMAFGENVGPCRALRDAIERRTGRSWIAAKIAQHNVRVAS